MTKRKQQSLDINVKGLSTQQILNMDVNDINRMNTRTIRALGSRLVSSMNKRIRALNKKAPMSQALSGIQNEFSIRGLDRNEIRSKIGEMIQFGKMKTSTVKGWNQYRKNIESKLGGKLSDLENESTFWETYRNLKDSNHAIFQKLSSDEVLKLTYDEYVNNPEDAMERVQNSLDDIYNALMGEDMMEEDLFFEDEDDEDSFF